MNFAAPPIGNQGDLPALTGLEADRGSSRDVETETARLRAIEVEGGVGFEEVVVRTHLDGPVTGIGYRQRDRVAAGVQFKGSRGRNSSPGIMVVPPGLVSEWDCGRSPAWCRREKWLPPESRLSSRQCPP